MTFPLIGDPIVGGLSAVPSEFLNGVRTTLPLCVDGRGGDYALTSPLNVLGDTVTFSTLVASAFTCSACVVSGLLSVGSCTVSGALTAASVTAEDITATQAIFLTGDASVTLSAAADDLVISGFADCAAVRVSLTASYEVRGIAGGAAGRVILIQNVSAAFNLTLVDQAGSSSAVNRIIRPGSVVLAPNESVWMRYDGVSSRWRVIGAAT